MNLINYLLHRKLIMTCLIIRLEARLRPNIGFTLSEKTKIIRTPDKSTVDHTCSFQDSIQPD